MSKKNDNGAPSLDLGLGAILAHAQGGEETPAAKEPRAPTAILTLDEAAGELKNEFSTLAEAKQWGVLVSKAETAISSDQDYEARLWWIRGHLGAFSLPVSLLAAPFETVCRQLHGRPEARQAFNELVSEIGEIMLERLRGVGDHRQEHGVRHALTQLGLLRGATVLPHPQSSAGALPRRFELGDRQSAEERAVDAPAGLLTPRRSNRKGWFLLAGLALVSAAAALYLARDRFVEAHVLTASESFVPGDSVSEQQTPIVSARAMAGSLGALYYSIAEATAAADKNPVRPPKPAPQAAQGRSAPTSLDTSTTAPAHDKPIPQQQRAEGGAGKETVNTDGPIEGSAFQSGVERRGQQEARLPGSVGNDSAPEPRPSVLPAEVGGLVMGEVKSVLVATNVLASPNYRAPVIARLREGDKVSVETRVGQWVRIRSRRGKTGFIFAQDVGESDDFTTTEGQ